MEIFKGKIKNGKEYCIRHLKISDVKALMDYINALSIERTFILRQGEQISYDEEKKFVESQLTKIREKRAIFLVVEMEKEIVGAAQINLKERIHAHVGHLGISLLKEVRDQGIGSKLLESILNQSVQELPTMKLIDLTVFEINDRAKHLYKKFGFKEFGRLPKSIFYKGEYIDEIYMYREV